MRLLNAETRELELFEGDDVPAYAALSHTWGQAQEEILFQDLSGTRTWYATTGPPPDSPKAVGWKKLSGACRQALNDNLQYVWIDTCCIDKSSSAELSEAINSMFRWYATSSVCYAYLADVYAGTNPRSDQAMEDFRASRWFTRGWTLQELLAPADVRFFDARWLNLGGKYMLRDTISTITGINVRYIGGLPNSANRPGWDSQHLIATASVGEKMSWAAARQTTRVEDNAYCLLGIFDITMPMVYGEGDRAFARLQENIIEATDDCSLLAWNFQVSWPRSSGAWSEMKPSLLAPNPAAFRHCRGLIPRKIPRHHRPAFSMTQRGLKLKAPVV
ncbi:HET-domain-containing protein, partial [Coniochaeta sp. PMI_546]